MHIIHLFKYLLPGFILLLPAIVEAGPTPYPAQPELLKRAAAAVSHPSAKHSMMLFHGTENSAAASSMAHHVDLSKTHVCGDFHHNAKHGSDGGAYFTDSLVSAAQFSCYNNKYDPTLKLPTTVYVLAFHWTPGSYKVYEFEQKDKFSLSDAQCTAYDMITGPMWNPYTDKYFTDDFWQYAIVKQAAVSGLAYVHTYEVHCKNVPIGNALTGAMYEDGQGGNKNFNSLASHLSS